MTTATEQLLIRIDASTESLRRELRRANVEVDRAAGGVQRSLTRIDNSFERSRRAAMAATRAVAGFAGVGLSFAALTRGIQNIVRTTAALGDLSDRLGVSASALQSWRFAAEESGASAADLDRGLEMLTTRLGQFRATGTGPAAAALQRLGLDTAIARGEIQTSEEAFRAIIERMGGITSAADRAAIAGALMGDRLGPRLATLLGRGAEGLRQLEDQARSAGLVLDDELVAKAQEFDRAWSRAMSSVSTTIKAGVLTVMRDVGSMFDALANLPERWQEINSEVRQAEREVEQLTHQIERLNSAMARPTLDDDVLAQLQERADGLAERLREAERRLESLRATAEEDDKPDNVPGLPPAPVIERTTEAMKALQRTIDDQEKAMRRRQQERDEAEHAIRAQIEAIELETRLMQLSSEEREIEVALIEQQQLALAGLVSIREKDREALVAALRAQQQVRREMEAVDRALEQSRRAAAEAAGEWGRIWDEGSRGIQRSLAADFTEFPAAVLADPEIDAAIQRIVQ